MNVCIESLNFFFLEDPSHFNLITYIT
jgi:hypothetical protein